MQASHGIRLRLSRCVWKAHGQRWFCASAHRGHQPSGSITRKLPKEPARTRFAPSPTGYLHLGSLRTALFNYLLAKSTGGQFLLRIEDTDQKRTVPDAEEKLYQDMLWAGLQWDEGPQVGGPYGPYKQSERLELYHKHTQTLLDSGAAYRCFCSTERLNALAEERHKLGLPTHYDRTCTHLSQEESDERASKKEPHVIRLLSPPQYPDYVDLVYGKVRNRGSTKLRGHPAFEDPVLIKSDGFPTYHLANVVDDHLMKITHVVRGAEWMSSTPKHIAMYNAFGWEPPQFAHVGLLTDKDRQKLSKRKFDINVASYRDKMDVFPESLTNYVALLGWSHRLRNDVMSLEELVNNFDMNFTTGDAIVTMDKLWYIQKAHAERYIKGHKPMADKMANDVLQVAQSQLKLSGKGDSPLAKLALRHEFISTLLLSDSGNFTTPQQFYERNIYFFTTPDEAALRESLSCWNLPYTPKLKDIPTNSRWQELVEELRCIAAVTNEKWTVEELRSCIENVIKSRTAALAGELKIEGSEDFNMLRKAWSKLVHKFVRWAISAGKPGPNGAATMEMLGRDETINRLELAFKLAGESQEDEATK